MSIGIGLQLKNPLLEIASPTPEDRRTTTDNVPEPEANGKAQEDLTTQLSEDKMPRAEETLDTAGLDNVYADASVAERQAEAAAADPLRGEESTNWANVGKGSNSRFEDAEYDLENSLVADKTLRTHLLDQLGIASAAKDVRLIAAFLIEQIDQSLLLRSRLLCCRGLTPPVLPRARSENASSFSSRSATGLILRLKHWSIILRCWRLQSCHNSRSSAVSVMTT